jgi:hypothetical protein
MSLIVNPVYVSSTTAWARCINPEHEDKNPSLEITLTGEYEGRCYCHGCGKVWQMNKADIEKIKTRIDRETKPVYENIIDLYWGMQEWAVKIPEGSQLYIQKLMEKWNVGLATLCSLGIYWWKNRYFIPMWNEYNEVCGIQYLFPDGFKLAARGSKVGIFRGGGSLPHHETIFITEGCSDLATLLDLGFYGLGRQNCSSCVETIISVLEWEANTSNKLVVIADNDKVGIDGATKLCEAWNETHEPDWKMDMWIPEFKDLREEAKIKGKDAVRNILTLLGDN